MNSPEATAPSTAVPQLPSIDLAALNDAAGLQTRVDRKYVLDPTQLDALIDGLGSRLAVLEIEGRRSFSYESVYFDTPDLVCFRSAAHKRRRRFKVRTRTYLDQRVTMLEVKTRGHRKVTVKRRRPHPYEERAVLNGPARIFVATTTDCAGVPSRLEPVLTTTYHRTTLVDLDDVARLTIDADVRCTGSGCRSVGLDGYSIVETKSSGSPSASDRWLWQHGLRPETISKFGTGLAALDPSLPANKWHRTLQRYFR